MRRGGGFMQSVLCYISVKRTTFFNQVQDLKCISQLCAKMNYFLNIKGGLNQIFALMTCFHSFHVLLVI